ncbi:MAG: DUF126 domain-containing protein [Candidatus Aminicenantes bacterium]|nr:MAG: DUF126 domain-containing protein [Candidatus Aminicenantes bacterium]
METVASFFSLISTDTAAFTKREIPSLTTGKGSSGGDFAAWAAKENGNAPAAMICLEGEPVLSGAVIATEILTVDRPEKNVFDLIKIGDYVKVDATAGIIEVVGK